MNMTPCVHFIFLVLFQVIDGNDEFVYAGTLSGDIMQVR